MTSRQEKHTGLDEQPLVAIFNRRYHSVYGAQANVIRLARLMESSQRVMLTTANGEFYDACVAAGVECRVVETPAVFRNFGGSILRLGFVEKLLLVPQLILLNCRLWRVFTKTGARILLLTDVQSLPFALLICTFSRRKVMVYIQGDDTGPWLRVLAGVLADKILLIARSLETSFTRSWPACRRRLVVLYSGFPVPEESEWAQRKISGSVRVRFIEHHHLPSNALLVGLVGSITHRKGGDTLVQAARRILSKAPRARFVFFGSVSPGHEEFMKDLQDLIAEYQLSEYVIFAGFQPRETIFQCADVVTLPSRSEGLPSVLIEALSYGIGVVASDIAGTKEIIREPNVGQLVPVGSSEALADALIEELRKVEETREQREPREQARRQFVRENFSDARYLREFLNVCNELCNA